MVWKFGHIGKYRRNTFKNSKMWCRKRRPAGMFSFGQFPGVFLLIADVSEPSIGFIFMGRWIHPPAHEDGTDRGFRNIGF
jgi:hypothetical protein